MTPEQNIAEFLANLKIELQSRILVTASHMEDILTAATPEITKYYLKG